MVDTIIDFTPQFANILNTIGGFKKQLTELQGQVKGLERDVKRQMKLLTKKD